MSGGNPDSGGPINYGMLADLAGLAQPGLMGLIQAARHADDQYNNALIHWGQSAGLGLPGQPLSTADNARSNRLAEGLVLSMGGLGTMEGKPFNYGLRPEDSLVTRYLSALEPTDRQAMEARSSAAPQVQGKVQDLARPRTIQRLKDAYHQMEETAKRPVHQAEDAQGNVLYKAKDEKDLRAWVQREEQARKQLSLKESKATNKAQGEIIYMHGPKGYLGETDPIGPFEDEPPTVAKLKRVK